MLRSSLRSGHLFTAAGLAAAPEAPQKVPSQQGAAAVVLARGKEQRSVELQSTPSEWELRLQQPVGAAPRPMMGPIWALSQHRPNLRDSFTSLTTTHYCVTYDTAG